MTTLAVNALPAASSARTRIFPEFAKRAVRQGYRRYDGTNAVRRRTFVRNRPTMNVPISNRRAAIARSLGLAAGLLLASVGVAQPVFANTLPRCGVIGDGTHAVLTMYVQALYCGVNVPDWHARARIYGSGGAVEDEWTQTDPYQATLVDTTVSIPAGTYTFVVEDWYTDPIAGPKHGYWSSQPVVVYGGTVTPAPVITPAPTVRPATTPKPVATPRITPRPTVAPTAAPTTAATTAPSATPAIVVDPFPSVSADPSAVVDASTSPSADAAAVASASAKLDAPTPAGVIVSAPTAAADTNGPDPLVAGFSLAALVAGARGLLFFLLRRRRHAQD